MRILIILNLVLTPVLVWSQNLILNSSFEEVIDCPSDFDQLDKLQDWKSVGGTVDVFSECSLEIVPDPPHGPFEYANFNFGESYIYLGISFPFRYKSDTLFREFIQGETILDLSENPHYFSLHAYTNQENRTNHIGVYFSENDNGFIGSYPIDIEPQLEFDDWIGDYHQWKKHEGCVEDIGGSNYLTIGNFHEPGNDEVEFEDIEFSNGLFIDNLILQEIPVLSDTLITIYNGECVKLQSTLNNIPLNYYNQELESVKNILCPTNNQIINQKISSCNNVLRKIEIEVIGCSCDLYTPNIIAPNSTNDINSKFIVGFDNNCIENDFQLNLYNRWGNLVYNGSLAMFETEKLSQGVYVFTLEYLCRGKLQLDSGDFTILK